MQGGGRKAEYFFLIESIFLDTGCSCKSEIGYRFSLKSKILTPGHITKENKNVNNVENKHGVNFNFLLNDFLCVSACLFLSVSVSVSSVDRLSKHHILPHKLTKSRHM